MALLSVVCPLIVIGGALVGVHDFRDSKEARADANAGRVLNARVQDLGAVEAMDRIMLNEPEVVIVGPSFAKTDVSPRLLAERLGIERRKVAMLSVPNTVGAHWYAVLKYRVFEKGYRPRIVLVVSGLQSMMLTTPLTESSHVNLSVHLPPRATDPVLDQKVRRSTAQVLVRLREGRAKVRDELFRSARSLPARLFASPADPTRPLGPGETHAALARVFSDDKVDMSLYGSSTPIVEEDRDLAFFEAVDFPSPEESFVGDITALARAHGARIAWVRPPLSPNTPLEDRDHVAADTEERTRAVVEAGGGTWIDLEGLRMVPRMFRDQAHMNREGAQRFTEALVRGLEDTHLLDDAYGPDAAAPLVPEVVREAGAEGFSVPPGGAIRFRFPEGWGPERGPFRVVARLSGPARLAVDGAEVPLALQPGGGWSDALVEPPAEPFDVTVTAPADDPVEVVGLALGIAPWRSHLAGDDATLAGPRADVLGGADPLHPTYARAPVKVPGDGRAIAGSRRMVAWFDTERWAPLSDERLMGQTRLGSRCSPLRVLEDGVQLPLPNVPCTAVVRRGRGRSCHTPDAIYFTAPDGSDPKANGRAYTLVLDEERACDGAAWLYPRDGFEVAFPPERRAVLTHGASALVVGARYLNQRPAEVTVRLRVDGAVVVEERVDGRHLAQGPIAFPLEPPVRADAHAVVLEVRNHANTFYLFDQAALTERPGTRTWPLPELP